MQKLKKIYIVHAVDTEVPYTKVLKEPLKEFMNYLALK